MSDHSTTPESSIDHHAPSMTQTEFNDHLRNYLAVFGSLVVLTLVSFTFWYFEVPLAVQIVLTLLIASSQALLNLRYLMHLKGQGGQIKHFLILAAVFSFFLLGLPLLAFFDVIPGTHH